MYLHVRPVPVLVPTIALQLAEETVERLKTGGGKEFEQQLWETTLRDDQVPFVTVGRVTQSALF
jgi:hypothetical protein